MHKSTSRNLLSGAASHRWQQSNITSVPLHVASQKDDRVTCTAFDKRQVHARLAEDVSPRGPASADWAYTGRLQKMVRLILVLPVAAAAGVMQAVACMLAAPSLFTMLGKQGGKERADGNIKTTKMFRSTLQGKGKGSTAVGLGEKDQTQDKMPNTFWDSGEHKVVELTSKVETQHRMPEKFPIGENHLMFGGGGRHF